MFNKECVQSLAVERWGRHVCSQPQPLGTGYTPCARVTNTTILTDLQEMLFEEWDAILQQCVTNWMCCIFRNLLKNPSLFSQKQQTQESWGKPSRWTILGLFITLHLVWMKDGRCCPTASHYLHQMLCGNCRRFGKFCYGCNAHTQLGA